MLWLGALGAILATASLQAQPAGQWDFDSANLAPTVGSELSYIDGDGQATAQATQFGTTTSFGIPDIGGQPAKVMRFPASTAPMGFHLPVDAPANGEGQFLNQWTILFDVLYPAESASSWRPFIETDNRFIQADADLFVNPSGGIGISGQYDGHIETNTWYRIAFVVDTVNNRISKYINGSLVGAQGAIDGGTPALDGRWALDPGTGAELFNDNDENTAAGFVNSIQLRGEALSAPQILAFGGPSASGIPVEIPPVPSFVQSWTPRAQVANRDTALGSVIFTGDSTIADASISLKLDNTPLTGLIISRDGSLIQVGAASPGLFALGSDHTLTLSYLDSKDGQKTFSTSFKAVLFFEDFEGLTLGSRVEEELIADGVWTHEAPPGWLVDDTQMPGYEDPRNPATDGRAEWFGWSFASRLWWSATAGDQNRSLFTKGVGTVAITDPDEWDDAAHPSGLYTAYLNTPTIDLTGVSAGSLFVKFDSSWRPECCDDNAALDNSQTAVVTISYDGGEEIEILRWDSTPGSPNFHPDSENEAVNIPLDNPAGAKTAVVKFGLILAENDWWWAFDNLLVNAGVVPPSILTQPGLTSATAGQPITFSVTASGGQPLSYQWYKGSGAAATPIAGATSASLTFPSVETTDAGIYTVRVSNAGGSATSGDIKLIVLESFGGPVTDGLVVHLKFDGDANDSSPRGNNGTEVANGSDPIPVSYEPGRIGSALSYNSHKDGTSFSYVTLGQPEDLNVGTTVNFSISFWTKFSSWSGDPAFISNKNWNSGSNPGFVIATGGSGRLGWNVGKPRDDYGGPGGTMSDNNWHHVAFTVDRQGLIVIYLDGVQVSNKAHGAERDWTGLDWNIGQDGTGTYTDGGGVSMLDGHIDDLGIWTRAITEAEVKAIFRTGLEGKDLSEARVAPEAKKDLVVYLNFDDALTDGSGRGNNGTAVGTIGYTGGALGKALNYSSKKDGSSFNYVTLGTPADLNFGITNSFSASFWAKLNAWEADPAFLGNKDWGSGSNPGWVVATDGDGRIQWNIAANPDGTKGNRHDFDGPGGLFSDAQWHHIVVVFQRQPGAGVGRTYVDGTLLNATSYSGPENNLDTPAGKATNIGQDGLGTYTDGGGVSSDGLMDELGIWRRALSDDEVAGLYAAGVLGLPLTGASPALSLQLPPGRVALTLSPDRSTALLKWTARAGVRLQTAATLADPAAWQDVTGTLNLSEATVTVDPVNPAFFRLIRK